MTFTNELPTVPGFYARSVLGYVSSMLLSVDPLDGQLRSQHGDLVHDMGGQWCRLVPNDELVEMKMAKEFAEEACDQKDKEIERLRGEIGKAFHEGVEAWGKADATSDLWEDSRAKRVMEGKE